MAQVTARIVVSQAANPAPGGYSSGSRDNLNLNALITLTNGSNTGATSWTWEVFPAVGLVEGDYGVAGKESATCTLTPPASTGYGDLAVRLTVRGDPLPGGRPNVAVDEVLLGVRAPLSGYSDGLPIPHPHEAMLGGRPVLSAIRGALGRFAEAIRALKVAGGGVPTTRTITAGAGLTGGGDLSANRTLACDFGTTGNVARVGQAASGGSVGQPAKIDHVHQAEDVTARTAASALDGSEVVAVSQAGNLRRTTTASIAALAAGAGSDALWPNAVDGSRSESGTSTSLDRPRCYSSLTLSSSSVLNTAGHRLVVTGTLTVNTGCRLHNDGAASASNSGGSGGGLGGQLANANSTTGGSGGSVAVDGSAGSATTNALGGAGGAGGNGSQPSTGGAGGAATAPDASSVGLVWSGAFLDMMAAWNGTSFTSCMGGAPGGGGGGSNGGDNRTGGGGGQGGGIVWIRAKNVVVNGTGLISAKGGAGFSPAGPGGGGGGGGGGGVVIIWCDSFTGPGGVNDFAGALSVAGGAGGTASGSATNGTAGSAGTVMVFVKGVRLY